MGHSVGDALIVAAITAGIVGYLFLKSRERSRRLEILHAERVAAMDKGIPLPELPLDPAVKVRPDDPDVPLIIGIVLAAFGLGTMLGLSLIDDMRAAWPVPLPVAFMGLGLVLYHRLVTDGRRPSDPTRRGF